MPSNKNTMNKCCVKCECKYPECTENCCLCKNPSCSCHTPQPECKHLNLKRKDKNCPDCGGEMVYLDEVIEEESHKGEHWRLGYQQGVEETRKDVLREIREKVIGIIVKNSTGFDTIEGKRLWHLDIDRFETDLLKELK